MKGEGVLEYLKKGWDESKWKRVIRFRLGNEIKKVIGRKRKIRNNRRRRRKSGRRRGSKRGGGGG